MESVKALKDQLERYKILVDYMKGEIENLQNDYLEAQNALKSFQSVPFIVGQYLETIDQDYAIVKRISLTGKLYVRILSLVNRELLKPSALVGLARREDLSFCLIDVLPPDPIDTVSLLRPLERPDVTYENIGGYEAQKQELREVVEVFLKRRQLCRQIGIDPPRGVLLYGPPGTGKTMLVKAVANHTNAAFIRVVGSEFAKKYFGEGPQMVRDLFRLARENAPAIIFIDEVDAIATARSNNIEDKEMQRVLIELLNQMDGFDQTVNVMVIMATNRADVLDPALLRPGRLDRKIEFPYPDRTQKSQVFSACTAKMPLSNEVKLEIYASRTDKISPAEIAAICQEAGVNAIRKNQNVILPEDFEKGYRSFVKKLETRHEFYQ